MLHSGEESWDGSCLRPEVPPPPWAATQQETQLGKSHHQQRHLPRCHAESPAAAGADPGPAATAASSDAAHRDAAQRTRACLPTPSGRKRRVRHPFRETPAPGGEMKKITRRIHRFFLSRPLPRTGWTYEMEKRERAAVRSFPEDRRTNCQTLNISPLRMSAQGLCCPVLHGSGAAEAQASR